MADQLSAILLAAGRSSRMGRCKQLLPLGGVTVIDHCLRALLDGGVERIIAVIADSGNAVADVLRRYPATIAVNPAANADMTSSVVAGRKKLAPDSTGAIVFLSDQPLVLPATITTLKTAHAETPDALLIPCHDGRRGHPLLVPRDLLDELENGQTLRDLTLRNQGRIRELPVVDPGILLDMDTPEEYQRMCAAIDS